MRERNVVGLGGRRLPLHSARETEATWRHDPIHAVNNKSTRRDCEYTTGGLTGLLEPHIFWRFQKLELALSPNFFFDLYLFIGLWKIDSEFNVDDRQIENWKYFLWRSYAPSLQAMVDVVAGSTYIKSLTLNLGISMNVRGAASFPDDLGDPVTTVFAHIQFFL